MKKISKILSALLTGIILMSCFLVTPMAVGPDDNIDDFMFTFDQIMTMYEDNVWGTASVGKIEAKITENASDGTLIERTEILDPQTLDEYGYNQIVSTFSVICIAERNGLEITNCDYSLSFSDFSNIYTFKIEDTANNCEYRYNVSSDEFGFITAFSYGIYDYRNHQTISTVKYELKYLENFVLVDDGSFTTGYTNENYSIITYTPGANFYYETVSNDGGEIEVTEYYGFLFAKGTHEGTVELKVMDGDIDGRVIQTVYITVDFSFWDWVIYYVLFGWIWM